jgi:hypothetical protein
VFRPVLRSHDHGRTLRIIWDHLGDNLIYPAAALAANSQVPGTSETAGQGLLIFSSGKYRASIPYLACVPLDVVEQKSRVMYFKVLESGSGKPSWAPAGKYLAVAPFAASRSCQFYLSPTLSQT